MPQIRIRQSQVIRIELLQIVGERDIAGTDFTLPIGNNGTDGEVVVLHQFLANRKHIKLFDVACCPSYAPAHQHIELQPCTLADAGKTGNIHCLEKGEHGHGRIHPHLKCVGTGRFFGIYFFHTGYNQTNFKSIKFYRGNKVLIRIYAKIRIFCELIEKTVYLQRKKFRHGDYF